MNMKKVGYVLREWVLLSWAQPCQEHNASDPRE